MTTPEQDAIVQLGKAHDDLDARVTAFVDAFRSEMHGPRMEYGMRAVTSRAVGAYDAAVTETPADPDAVEILRAMNAAGRGKEIAERGEPDWVIDRDGDRWDRSEDGLYRHGQMCARTLGQIESLWGPIACHWVDTPAPAPDVTVEVRAPRWHKGEDAPDWLVPGATVRVVDGACAHTAGSHAGVVATFERVDEDGDANVEWINARTGLRNVCSTVTVLELVEPAPAPEPAVDWEARAKVAEARIKYATALRDDVLRHEIKDCDSVSCRMARILRGES